MQIINGKNKILGRVASEASSKLLKTKEKVIIVNAKDIIMSGTKDSILKKYNRVRDRKAKGNPLKGPKFYKYPDSMVKRSIRGMLPRSALGTSSLKRLKVYNTVPENIKEVPKEIELKTIEHLTLDQISRFLGAKLQK